LIEPQDSFDNDVIIENKDDDQPVVRPDGQKPRVKSNLLARLQNNNKQEPGDPAPKAPGNFRHSTKVAGTRRPKFTLGPSGGITLEDDNSTATTITFEPTPSEETVLTTTTTTAPEVSSTQAVTESSILSDFFSTQVLNTRAIDPTLASLHLSSFEQSKNINIRSLSTTTTTLATTTVTTTTTTDTTTTATSSTTAPAETTTTTGSTEIPNLQNETTQSSNATTTTTAPPTV